MDMKATSWSHSPNDNTQLFMKLLVQDFELCLFCLYVFLLPFSFCDNLQSIKPALVFVLRNETS